MNLTIGQPLWQSALYFILLPASIWLFRAVVTGTLPAVFTFIHTSRLFMLSFVPAALVLVMGVAGVALGMDGIINRTTITDEYLQIREFRRPVFRQKWVDLQVVKEVDATLKLQFLEGGRFQEVAYLSRDKLGDANY